MFDESFCTIVTPKPGEIYFYIKTGFFILNSTILHIGVYYHIIIVVPLIIMKRYYNNKYIVTHDKGCPRRADRALLKGI